jgi:hypothetical protein
MELRAATLEAVHRQTGIAQTELPSILERLAAMRYIFEADQDGETTYHYQAQPRDTAHDP